MTTTAACVRYPLTDERPALLARAKTATGMKTYTSVIDAALTNLVAPLVIAPRVTTPQPPTDGERLRQARGRADLSQRALALTLGDDAHSHQRVGRMERGEEELSAEALEWVEKVAP